MGIEIVNIGKSVPNLVVTNEDLTKIVDTSNEWIIERTGIGERRIAVTESALDFATVSAKEALGWEAGSDGPKIDADSIDLVIVATVTPDQMVPAMSSMLIKELDLSNAKGFDVNMACSGFMYGLWVAEALMKTNNMKRALVIGVERLSRITNWTDRGTCILFADGGGCALLENRQGNKGLLSSVVKNYDDTNQVLSVGMNYAETPFDVNWSEESTMYIKMRGTQVFRFAVRAVEEVMDEALKQAGLTADDIKYYVPHQANMRIINAVAQKFKQPIEKFQISIANTGNVSAASVPMALYDLMKSGKVKENDKIMLVGFGGGLSAGASIFEI